MTQQNHHGPGIAGAHGYGALTGPSLDGYLRHVQVFTQENVYYESQLDRIAMSPVVRNQTGPGMGSTLRFKTIGTIGVHPLDNNGKIPLQESDVSWRSITIGEQLGWGFKISKKDMMWEPQFINEIVVERMKGVARSTQAYLETQILAKQIAEASRHNRGHQAGMVEHCTNLGTKEKPLELTPDNVAIFFQDLHDVAYQMGLAENQIFMAMPQFMRTLIARAGFLCDASKTGLPRSALLMDPDSVRREMTAADVIFSQKMPKCPPGEGGNTTDKIVYPIIFGSPTATGYAVYSDTMEMIDKVKGESSVYFQGTMCIGDAVLEDCMLGVAWVSVDKKLLSAFPYEEGPDAPPDPDPGP